MQATKKSVKLRWRSLGKIFFTLVLCTVMYLKTTVKSGRQSLQCYQQDLMFSTFTSPHWQIAPPVSLTGVPICRKGLWH